jgi:hypothetical protein
MAKRKKTVKTNDHTTTNGVAAPEGFEEVFGARVAGWFFREAGNVLQGILRESFEVKSRFTRESDGKKLKRVYKVEVTAPGCLIEKTDAEGAVEAQLGELVGLDESGWLKRLGAVEPGREVWISCDGKDTPSDDYPQGAWRFRVLAKKGSGGTNPVTGEARR